jgi:hypothetical protein
LLQEFTYNNKRTPKNTAGINTIGEAFAHIFKEPYTIINVLSIQIHPKYKWETI